MEKHEKMDTSEPLKNSDEEAVWTDAFNMFDINGDGGISISEFALVVRGFGYNPSLKSLEDFVRETLPNYEPDQQMKGNEPKIDRQQFMNMMRKVQTNLDRNEDLKEAFRVFDSNGDGTIDKEELSRVLTNLGETMTPQEVDEMYAVLDANGDKKINYHEFTTFCNTPFKFGN